MGTEGILVWNVCGFNANTHYDALMKLVASERPSIACLQETKLVAISSFDVIQLLS
jgi:exonuclease III